MRDFNSFSIKIQSFSSVKFLKNFFINAVFKFFWSFFLQNVSILRLLEFCFFFCSERWIFVSDDLFSFLCLVCWTMKCIRFSWFCYSILTFKNQELVFVAVFVTLCPYSSHSLLYPSSSVLVPIFILVFQLLKIEWFQLFLNFTCFFSLHLISLNMRQFSECDRKRVFIFLTTRVLL